MRVLWICGLPSQVQRAVFDNEDHGSTAAWSWIVAHFPPPPGVELHIACLWPGGSCRKDFDYEGAHFHLIPCPRRGRALLLFQRDAGFFRGLHDELNPEVVHGWGTEDSFGLVARRLAPRRHVIGIQGLIKAYRKRVPMHRRYALTEITERWTLARARQVVAESGYSLRVAQPLCPNANLTVIEHPLRREFLDAPPGDGTGRTVLFLGAIDERKGISDALRAFAGAARAASDWRLRVVGRGSTKSEQAMRTLAGSLGIEDRFQHDPILGSAEIVEAMRESSVYLLPTRIDTGPTALKEALVMGLWPVCYDNSGPGEYIRLCNFGSIARDLDRADIETQLASALRERPWMDSARRTALRAFALERFSPDRIWRELERLYREIIAAA